MDAGRILVDRENGTLELMTPQGTSLRTIELNAAIVRGARLQGRDLVVLTTTSVEVMESNAWADDPKYPGRVAFIPFGRLPLP